MDVAKHTPLPTRHLRTNIIESMYVSSFQLRILGIGIGAIFFGVVSAGIVAHAQTSVSRTTTSDDTSAFTTMAPLTIPELVVPTVVEVPLGISESFYHNVGVYDVTEGIFVPTVVKETAQPLRLVVQSSPAPRKDVANAAQVMVDGNRTTYAAYDMPPAGEGQVAITVVPESGVFTSSRLSLQLDRNVTPPTTIQIEAITTTPDGKMNTVVVAKKKFNASAIDFPQTTASAWIVTLGYTQPLRINELTFVVADSSLQHIQTARFLAQPEHEYMVYRYPDHIVNISAGEAGHIADGKALRVKPNAFISNPEYVPADSDDDGIPDARDNCPNMDNGDQADIDHNGIGDACDDYDRDSVLNINDNCPNDPNTRQADADGDGIGDVCDDEESRFTEAHAWVPWAGIGFAAVVIVGLLIFMVRTQSADATGKREESDTPEPTDPMNE
jgi:hypothetical protein